MGKVGRSDIVDGKEKGKISHFYAKKPYTDPQTFFHPSRGFLKVLRGATLRTYGAVACSREKQISPSSSFQLARFESLPLLSTPPVRHKNGQYGRIYPLRPLHRN